MAVAVTYLKLVREARIGDRKLGVAAFPPLLELRHPLESLFVGDLLENQLLNDVAAVSIQRTEVESKRSEAKSEWGTTHLVFQQRQWYSLG